MNVEGKADPCLDNDNDNGGDDDIPLSVALAFRNIFICIYKLAFFNIDESCAAVGAKVFEATNSRLIGVNSN
jgi:hypothetical protein